MRQPPSIELPPSCRKLAAGSSSQLAAAAAERRQRHQRQQRLKRRPGATGQEAGGYVNELDDWQRQQQQQQQQKPSLSAASRLDNQQQQQCAFLHNRPDSQSAATTTTECRCCYCCTKEVGGATMIQSFPFVGLGIGGGGGGGGDCCCCLCRCNCSSCENRSSSGGTKEWEVCLINYVRPSLAWPVAVKPFDTLAEVDYALSRIKFEQRQRQKSAALGREQQLEEISKLATNQTETATTAATTAKTAKTVATETTGNSPSDQQKFSEASGGSPPSRGAQVNIGLRDGRARSECPADGGGHEEEEEEEERGASSFIATIYLGSGGGGGGYCPTAPIALLFSTSNSQQRRRRRQRRRLKRRLCSLWSSDKQLQTTDHLDESLASSASPMPLSLLLLLLLLAAATFSGPIQREQQESSYLLSWIVAFCLLLLPLPLPLQPMVSERELVGSLRKHSCKSASAVATSAAAAAAVAAANEQSINMIDRRQRRSEKTDTGTNVAKRNRRAAAVAAAAPIGSKCDTTPDTGRRRRALLPSLTLLLMLLLALATQRAAPTGAPPHPPKRDIWKQALGVALAEDEQAKSVERLADRLANWTDQQQATLFYLSLLARNSRLMGSKESFSSSWCRSRVSLGPLLSPLPPPPPPLSRRASYSSSDADAATATATATATSRWELLSLPSSGTAIEQDDQEQEADDEESTAAAVKLMDKLGAADGRFVDSAKLAVENANLISRLLIHQEENEVIRRISSQRRFFNYILESKLKSVSSRENSVIDALGLVFLSTPADKQDDELQQQQQKHQSSSSATSSGADKEGNENENENEDEDEIAFAPVSRRLSGGAIQKQHQQQQQQQHEIETRDLSVELNNKLSVLFRPNFVRRWIEGRRRGRRQQLLSSISGRLSSSSNSGELNFRQDGRWFWPQLDCGLSNKWVLTYSVPFFGYDSAASLQSPSPSPDGRRGLSLRGVAYVNLDVAKLNLIDQCASKDSEAPVLFRNTHQCGKRLKRSQCVTLAPDESGEFRGGNYVCQCPLASTVQRLQREAVQKHRDHLAEIVIAAKPPPVSDESSSSLSSSSMSMSMLSSPLDKLVLEPEEGRLLDKGQLGSRLLLASQRQHQAGNYSAGGQRHYFMAGAQLDLDAALQWFASTTTTTTGAAAAAAADEEHSRSMADDSISLDWPEQVCRRCNSRPTTATAATEATAEMEMDSETGHGATTTTTTNKQPTADTCSDHPGQSISTDYTSAAAAAAASAAARLNWFRPLVLAIQSACALATLCLIGILFRLRKSRVILVSGWLMLETTLAGALILYCSVFVRYFEPTSLTCLLEPWLRELGFSIFYGSILIKLYRILTEFQTRKAHRVCFRDKDQVVYLLAIVLIVIGYMSAWTALMVDGFLFGGNNQSSPFPSYSSTQYSQPLPLPMPLNISSNDSLTSGQGPLLSASRAAALVLQQQQQQPVKQANIQQQQQQQHDHQQQTTANSTSARYLRSASAQQATAAVAAVVAVAAEEFQEAEDPLAKSLGSSASSGDGDGNGNGNSGAAANGGARMVDQLLAQYAPEQLRIFARNLDSFGELFSGLLERGELKYDESSESFVAAMRCRKLTWDYVTELSEFGLLLFGIYLVYKLRNANGDVHKEKLCLCAPIFIELLVSGCAYSLRHALWSELSSNHLLLIYFLRCQLTVTVSLALVFGPKLWTICKSKPSLFRQAMGAGSGSANVKSSARHRCHLTCELHDHHLNDAMRLHQAMLSNSALDIGSIDLADMDPDEIQAELKRVYTQLEILKTKVMRRDNPHISKRRGGRKTSHRKFSLQAFHAHRQQHSSGGGGSTCQQQQQQPGSKSSTLAAAADGRLPSLLESQSETEQQQQQQQSPRSASKREEPTTGSGGNRRVRMESGVVEQQNPDSTSNNRPHQQQQQHQQQHQQHQHQQHNHNHNNNHQHHHPHPHPHHHHHHHHRHHHHHNNSSNNNNNNNNTGGNHEKHQHQQRQQMAANKCNEREQLGGRNLVSADPNSTGSAVYFDDETIIMNDSQSSGNVSPQRRSSFVCSQSSIHPDDSSLN